MRNKILLKEYNDLFNKLFKNFICLFLITLSLNIAAESLDKIIAVINDEVITDSELNVQVQLFKQQLLAKGVKLPSEQVLRKQVLQHLIDLDLQLQLAKQNDISVDSIDLQSAIEKIASNNHLSLEQLRIELSKQGMPWKVFRENVRKEIMIGRLHQKAIGKDISVSPEQVAEYLAKAKNEEAAQQLYHLQNILIPLPEAPTTTQLAKGEQKAKELLLKINRGDDFSNLAIAESSGEFALEGGDLGERHLAELPEIFAKAIVKMKKGAVVGPIRTGNGLHLLKLLDVKAKNNEKHEVTRTHVRHILLKQDAGITAEELAKQVENIYQQLKAGKDFAVMAKQYSSDPISSKNGGDLGWLGEGEATAEFENVMNSLAVREISKPIKSLTGWQIIQVIERKKIDDTASFKRLQIKQFLQQQKFAEAVQSWQQHIRAQAYVSILDKQLA